MPTVARPSRDPAYLLAVVRHRAAHRWRFLVVVTAVVVIVATLLTALGLLVGATDAGAVRGGLAEASTERTAVNVQVLGPTGPTGDVVDALEDAATRVFGSEIDTRSQLLTETSPAAVRRDGAELTASVERATDDDTASTAEPTPVPAPTPVPVPVYGYLGSLTAPETGARLVSGTWGEGDAGGSGDSGDSGALGDSGAPAAAVPESARTALALSEGDRLTVSTTTGDVTVTVTGFYTARTTGVSADGWATDPLRGAGSNPAFPKPGQRSVEPVYAVGPLLVAPGGLDATGVTLSTIHLAVLGGFGDLDPSSLPALRDRLADADVAFDAAVGRRATTVAVDTRLVETIDAVQGGILLTRATVAVTSALLIVLAAAALAQVARVMTEAGITDRRLLRSRGASPARVLALIGAEALAVGIVAAAVAPPLAALVYRAVAVVPAMVDAGMPREATISWTAWAGAAAVSALFVVIQLAPLVGRRAADDDGARRDAQRGTLGTVARHGADLAVVALAVVAAVQLLRSDGTVREGTLGIDPVLAVAPAIVLLGCVLLGVRLMPLVARLVQRAAARSRGATGALAGWEVGRRGREATAAVLIVSLALAVGIFSLTFLSTWRQSQADQAALAVGAPVRVVAATATGEASPALRRGGALSQPDRAAVAGDGVSGTPVQVLGLDEAARDLATRGRSGDEGGDAVASGLGIRTAAPVTSGITLPDDADALGLTVQASALGPDGLSLPPSDATGALSARVSAVLQDADGVIEVVALGSVDVNGPAVALRAPLTRGSAATGADESPRMLVGFQTTFGSASDGASTSERRIPVEVTLGEIDAGTTPLAGAADIAGWNGTATDPVATAPLIETGGDGGGGDGEAGPSFRVAVDLPGSTAVSGEVASIVAWRPTPSIPLVVTEEAAARLGLALATPLRITIDGVAVDGSLAGTAAVIPGSAATDALAAGVTGLATAAAGDAGNTRTTVVADQTLLARGLAEAGAHGVLRDEWWVDVPAGAQEAYTAGTVSIDGVTRALQEGPLRIGTQAALWLGILGSVVLVAVGFGMHAAASMRARRVEFAQLRAVGLTRRGVTASVALEAALLCALGVVSGLVSGLLLAALVRPLVAVSPSGSPPVPGVRVVVPGDQVALLCVEIAVIVVAVVLVVARTQRTLHPADLLREGVGA